MITNLRSSDSFRIHAVSNKGQHSKGTFEETNIKIEEETEDKMEKSFERVEASFLTIRTGRANPTMLNRINVDYYGQPTPIQQLAGISVPDATQLVIQPYDKSAVAEIEKAIIASDLGVTPNNDGNVIRLKIPALTADRRKEMTKTISKLGEEGKVAVRNVRRDAMKQLDKLEKDSDISEDLKKSLSDSVQKLTDQYVEKIDKLIKMKQEDVTRV